MNVVRWSSHRSPCLSSVNTLHVGFTLFPLPRSFWMPVAIMKIVCILCHNPADIKDYVAIFIRHVIGIEAMSSYCASVQRTCLGNRTALKWTTGTQEGRSACYMRIHFTNQEGWDICTPPLNLGCTWTGTVSGDLPESDCPRSKTAKIGNGERWLSCTHLGISIRLVLFNLELLVDSVKRRRVVPFSTHCKHLHKFIPKKIWKRWRQENNQKVALAWIWREIWVWNLCVLWLAERKAVAWARIEHAVIKKVDELRTMGRTLLRRVVDVALGRRASSKGLSPVHTNWGSLDPFAYGTAPKVIRRLGIVDECMRSSRRWE